MALQEIGSTGVLTSTNDASGQGGVLILTNAQRLADIVVTTGELGDALTLVETSVDGFDERISDTEEIAAAVLEASNAATLAVDGFAVSLGVAVSDIEELQTQFEATQNTLDTLEADLAAVSETALDALTTVDALVLTVAQLDDDLDAVSITAQDALTTVDALVLTVAQLDDDLDAVSATLAAHIAAYPAAENIVTADEAGDIIAYGVIVRVDSAATIDAATLEEGRVAYVSDTAELRVGDGATTGGLRVVTGYRRGVVTLTGTSSVATDSDDGDFFIFSATESFTLTAPAGTPVDGQKSIWRIKNTDDATITVTLTTTSGGFRFNDTVTALDTVPAGETIMLGAVYNAADDRWDVIAVVVGI